MKDVEYLLTKLENGYGYKEINVASMNHHTMHFGISLV